MLGWEDVDPKVDEGESGNMVRAWTTDKCTKGLEGGGGNRGAGGGGAPKVSDRSERYVMVGPRWLLVD